MAGIEFTYDGDHASADPLAGTVAPNGKLIVSAEDAGYNLSRSNQDWYTDNYGELDDGVLNYGFWDLDSLLSSYYVNADGTTAFTEAYYYENFVPLSGDQMALARNSVGMWDDLIGISFQETPVGDADITFGNTDDGPFSGAYAYLPFGDGLDAIYEFYYGFEEVGRLGGDVWINTQADANYVRFGPGYYANHAMTHELGHALGLSHAGEYNATNPDGSANPADYEGDAYFFQDSHQYTIMSYFFSEVTGANWINWNTLSYGYAGTPMVHDIVAIQQMYGADTTTRLGDTVYGFNSTADRPAYDITKAFVPVFTIWDAGGNDTLDLSGYNSNSVIDLNEGAFSSAGGSARTDLSLAEVNANRVALGLAERTQEDYDYYQELAETYDITSGYYKDNIAIAYGAKVENAIGGGGNDTITGNALSNKLVGGAGNDVLTGGDGVDYFTLGSGADRVVAEINAATVASKQGPISLDTILDFKSGTDKIDLSGIDAKSTVAGDQAFTLVKNASGANQGDLYTKTFGNMNAAENSLGMDLDGVSGSSPHGGKVTVVFGNTDADAAAEFAIALVGVESINTTDFIYG